MTAKRSAVLPSIDRLCAGFGFVVLLGLGVAAGAAPSNPILFATQVPSTGDFAGRASTFANHMTSPQQVARGGDLMIRYPDGSLRNLTQEAGFGMAGLQGTNAIAVREPSVHWSGTKAVFSMVVGAPPVQYSQATFKWQLYEVTNLAPGQTAVITKVANQPDYNNVSPFYGTDDRILFTSDRPFNGQAHLYPQLDEYESTPTVTGIWSLDPANGNLRLLNHAPSGAFSPFIDSFGRVVFTRWDHLQRDQQADADAGENPPPYGSFNFASEAPGAAHLPRSEMFPEPRSDTTSATYGPVNGHRFNQFSPWQMNEDGTDEETLNHMGRHELSFGYLIKSFASDPKLSDVTNDSLHANNFSVGMDTGLFQMREDPVQPGNYFAVYTREFATLSSGQIFRVNGGPAVNPDAMALTARTGTAGTSGGRYRNPLPLANGELVSSHTLVSGLTPNLMTDFRLKQLALNVGTGFYEAGTPLTSGIVKSVTWWSPDTLQSFNGALWEIEAVEVVARTRPSRPALPLEAPERDVFTETGVNEAAFRNWLATNDLALIVTRNHTSRDRGDKLQPFNLRVPGGVQTVAPGGGRVYDVAHFQVLQGDLIRGYDSRGPGRRVIAQPLHAPNAQNLPNPGGPAGSVKIAPDGSSAAFVPARRALAWQSTDAAGEPIVRERVWVTFQPGEVRVCASCHGVNTKNQVNADTPVNKPEALRELLVAWKATHAAPKPVSDFNGNGASDVLFANADGRAAIWLMNGTAPTATQEIIGAGTGWSVKLVADFDGDGKSDLGWQHTDGRIAVYTMNGTTPTATAQILNAGGGWSITHAPDLNGDGKADLVFQNVDGTVAVWTMNGTAMTGGTSIIAPGTGWSVIRSADFDGDGKDDLLWRHADGRHAIWLMNGLTVASTAQILNSGGWTATHTPDLNGDGKADLVWQHTDGTIAVWLMNGAAMSSGTGLLGAGSGWSVTRTGDFDGNGKADLFFLHADGRAAIYLMNGLAPTQTTQILNAGGGWSAKRLQDVNGDGKADIVWENVDGRIAIWLMNGTAMTSGAGLIGAGTGWSVNPPGP